MFSTSIARTLHPSASKNLRRAVAPSLARTMAAAVAPAGNLVKTALNDLHKGSADGHDSLKKI